MLSTVFIWGLLLSQIAANTISQFIKPSNSSSFLKETEVEYPDIKIHFDFNHTKQINDFTHYVDIPKFLGMNQKIVFTFDNVPIYNDNSYLQGFFNKVCWSPASGVDLDNLDYSVNRENNEVNIILDIISLSKFVEGFYIYISLEELSFFGILPWSLVSMIKFLVYSIGSILISIMCIAAFFWKKYVNKKIKNKKQD